MTHIETMRRNVTEADKVSVQIDAIIKESLELGTMSRRQAGEIGREFNVQKRFQLAQPYMALNIEATIRKQEEMGTRAGVPYALDFRDGITLEELQKSGISFSRIFAGSNQTKVVVDREGEKKTHFLPHLSEIPHAVIKRAESPENRFLSHKEKRYEIYFTEKPTDTEKSTRQFVLSIPQARDSKAGFWEERRANVILELENLTTDDLAKRGIQVDTEKGLITYSTSQMHNWNKTKDLLLQRDIPQTSIHPTTERVKVSRDNEGNISIAEIGQPWIQSFGPLPTQSVHKVTITPRDEVREESYWIRRDDIATESQRNHVIRQMNILQRIPYSN